MAKVVKLIFVSTDNNNKFYHMTENESDNSFLVEYGRIGSKSQTSIYPMSKWDSTYKSKTKKGYKDNTDLYVVENVYNDKKSNYKEFLNYRSIKVVDIVKKLQSYATGSIKENYTVSSENVTQKQIDKAQSLLNELSLFNLTKDNIEEFNKMLIEFYGIVPRKMKHVRNHLIDIDSDLLEKKSKILLSEQELLDIMAGQVLLDANLLEDQQDDQPDILEHDIISSSGLEINEVIDINIIKQIKSLMQDQSHKFKHAFEVINNKTQVKYNEQLLEASNNKVELFWHGSRNENWWNILTTGLLIRPNVNVHINGKMFGFGTYFASKFLKSYGYTSARNAYHTKGNSNEAILALYSVHVGKQKTYNKHLSECYSLDFNKINKMGFDSVYAKAGVSIMNDEFIIYKESQCTVKYLVIVEA